MREIRNGKNQLYLMKRNLASAFTCAISTALLLGVAGCGKSSSSAPETKLPAGTASAEPTSFNEVAAQLDTGGNFYLYLSTEQFLDNLSGRIAGFRNFFNAIPGMSGEDRANVGKAFDIVTRLVKDSGIEDISGFGMSSIATEKSLYHSKAFLHHYAGKGSGFFWKLFGEKAHPLTGLDLLPSTTALAVFSDMDAALMWNVLKDQVHKAGIPEAESFLEQMPQQFEMKTGMKWDKVIGSLGGECGIVVTLDESRMITFPMPGRQKLEVPEPGIALVLKVNDDTLFNRVDQLIAQTGQQPVSVDESGLKMRTIPVPIPVPIQLRPSIASSGGYLFIAPNDRTIQEMLAVKSGKSQGLKSTDEFKRMSKNVPTEGNEFSFVSQRFGQTLIRIQKQVMEMAGDRNPGGAFFASLMDPEKAGFSYSVSANTDQGWLTVGNGNKNPAIILAAVPVAVVGVVAAVAVPNFVRARQAAQRNAMRSQQQ